MIKEQLAVKTGRRSILTGEVTDEICRRLIGGESLRKICSDDQLPSARTVFDWLSANVEFREKYTRAKELQVEGMLDEILEIADDVTECPKSRSVRIAARQWLVTKLMPKKYGDRVDLAHSGEVAVRVVIGGSTLPGESSEPLKVVGSHQRQLGG